LRTSFGEIHTLLAAINVVRFDLHFDIAEPPIDSVSGAITGHEEYKTKGAKAYNGEDGIFTTRVLPACTTSSNIQGEGRGMITDVDEVITSQAEDRDSMGSSQGIITVNDDDTETEREARFLAQPLVSLKKMFGFQLGTSTGNANGDDKNSTSHDTGISNGNTTPSKRRGSMSAIKKLTPTTATPSPRRGSMSSIPKMPPPNVRLDSSINRSGGVGSGQSNSAVLFLLQASPMHHARLQDDGAAQFSEDAFGHDGQRSIPSFERCTVSMPGWRYPDAAENSSAQESRTSMNSGSSGSDDDDDGSFVHVLYETEFFLPTMYALRENTWNALHGVCPGVEEVDGLYKWSMWKGTGDFYNLDAAIRRRFPTECDRLPKLRRGMVSTGASLEEMAEVLKVYLQCIVATRPLHCEELVDFCYPQKGCSDLHRKDMQSPTSQGRSERDAGSDQCKKLQVASPPPLVAHPLSLQPYHFVQLDVPPCTCLCNSPLGSSSCSSCSSESGVMAQPQSWIVVWTFSVNVVQSRSRDQRDGPGGSEFEVLETGDVDPIPNFPTCTCGREAKVVFSSFFNNKMVCPPSVVTQLDGQVDGFFSPCEGILPPSPPTYTHTHTLQPHFLLRGSIYMLFLPYSEGMRCLARGDGTCSDIDKRKCSSGQFELRW
jgi:hypothetical protein